MYSANCHSLNKDRSVHYLACFRVLRRSGDINFLSSGGRCSMIVLKLRYGEERLTTVFFVIF